MGCPRDFFGFRDIDQQHDWNSDLQEFHLVVNLETFIAPYRQLGTVVEADMLNIGQRQIYDHVVNGYQLGHE